jgi:potassium-transporting ATPase potassium-binding subunit
VAWQGWLQIAVFAALVTAAARPFGAYIAIIVEGRGRIPQFLTAFEHGLYRLAGVDPAKEQDWVRYAFAVLCFHFFGIVVLYGLQARLPFNAQGLEAVAPDLVLNTAVSSATNTSWQSYAGETTLSYLSQMTGLTVQSFLCRPQPGSPWP